MCGALLGIPHVGLRTDDDTLRVSPFRDREGGVEPGQVGAGALLTSLCLCGSLTRCAVPDVLVVVRTAREIDRHEDDARLGPDHVLNELLVRRMIAVVRG